MQHQSIDKICFFYIFFGLKIFSNWRRFPIYIFTSSRERRNPWFSLLLSKWRISRWLQVYNNKTQIFIEQSLIVYFRLWSSEKLMQEKRSLYHRNTVLGKYILTFLYHRPIALTFLTVVDNVCNDTTSYLIFWWLVEQRIELHEDKAKDKVLTEAELTAGINLASFIKASVTGKLSLNDYNQVN